TTTANITAATVTATVTAQNKEYDSTTNATVTCTVTGKLTGDDVTCSAASAAFDNPNAGTGKIVTATGLSLGGAAAPDYTLASTPARPQAESEDPPVTATVVVQDKQYDGTTTGSITSCTLSGVFGNDDVHCGGGTASFDTAAVGGAKTVTVSGLSLTGLAA